MERGAAPLVLQKLFVRGGGGRGALTIGQVLVNVFCKKFAKGRDLIIEGVFSIFFFSFSIKTCFPKTAASIPLSQLRHGK